jgi:hypothetical protein
VFLSISSLGVAVRPHQQRIEVLEDGPVLLVDRTVSLVDDDQVEVAYAEAPLPVVCVVDQPHHRGVGRDEHAPFGVLVGHQVHGRRVRQMRLEGVHGLVDQRHTVGQEQHALGPVGAHQHVGQRDDRACLAGASGHHQQ